MECRQRRQETARQRKIYESLFRLPERTDDQSLTMAEACISLIENRAFPRRQSERVRMLLNSIPVGADVRQQSRFSDLVLRLHVVEKV